MTHKILVVEDEEDLLNGLEVNLTREGYQVLKANRGDVGLNLALREQPSLILLDVMMPAMNGFDVCREIRRKGMDVPIIMLTARNDEIDRVVGLELGADDYLSKPFNLRELMARIHVQLRRRAQSGQVMTRYRFGRVEVDFPRMRATRGGEPVEFTSREFQVLKYLIQHRGELVTRDQLLDDVWGADAFPTTRTVDNHILKLRKKLEEDPANPRYLLSVHGEGYKFMG